MEMNQKHFFFPQRQLKFQSHWYGCVACFVHANWTTLFWDNFDDSFANQTIFFVVVSVFLLFDGVTHIWIRWKLQRQFSCMPYNWQEHSILCIQWMPFTTYNYLHHGCFALLILSSVASNLSLVKSLIHSSYCVWD